jgi:hypothetical protein
MAVDRSAKRVAKCVGVMEFSRFPIRGSQKALQTRDRHIYTLHNKC